MLSGNVPLSTLCGERIARFLENKKPYIRLETSE